MKAINDVNPAQAYFEGMLLTAYGVKIFSDSVAEWQIDNVKECAQKQNPYKIIDMNIKRFDTFPGMNEDAILNVCRHPNALQLLNEAPFYKDDKLPVFLFVEEEDITWIMIPESFSMNIRFAENPLEKKANLIEQIYGLPIAVFIMEKKVYSYYGIYKLENPYHNVGGLNGVLDHYAPLVFQYVGE